MYQVSNAYIEAMHSSVQSHKITLYISQAEARSLEYPIRDDNLVSGSVEFSNQCSGQTDLTLGSVYIGTLNFTLHTNAFLNFFTRGSVVGLKVRAVFSMLIDEASNTWEDVPVGIYTISSALYTEQGIKCVAYDNMSKLDVPVGSDTVIGIPWQIATYICGKCDLELGQTAYDIQNYPNANEVLGLFPENGIKTYRDMMSYLAAAVGGFATAGRDGKILIKRYSAKENYVDVIDTDSRLTGSSFSDYATRYSGIVDTKGDEETLYGSRILGVVIDMGGNPFLYYGENSTRRVQHLAILNNVTRWQYTPFSSSMLGNPAYDLGDCLKFVGGLAGDESYCLINKISWKYKRTYSIAGYGSNPNFSKADTSNKAVNKLNSSSSASMVRYFRTENIGELYWNLNVEPSEDSHTVGFVDFTANDDTEVEFWAQIQLTDECWTGVHPGYIDITTTAYIDNEEVCKVVKRVNAAQLDDVNQHTDYETLLGSGIVGPNSHRLKVDVSISATDIMTTGFTCGIGEARMLLKGQGLLSEENWNGELILEEYVSTVSVGVNTELIQETTVTTSSTVPITAGFEDSGIGYSNFGITVPDSEDITEEFIITRPLDPKWPICGDGFIANNNTLL